MGYREKYFRENKGFMGKYRCVRCGKWFKKSDIDIDHILPKSRGGNDELYNLQAMFKHCNRSKGNSTKGMVKDLVRHNAKRAVKKSVKSLFK